MKNRDDVLNNIFSSEELSLLDVINASYLSIEDVKWLRSKRWFKRFLITYAKELKKRYQDKPIVVKKFDAPKKDDIEVLDFTQKINIPSKEIVEILDFTRTLDITDVRDIVSANETAKKKIILEKNILSGVIGVCLAIIVALIIILLNWGLENKKTDDMVEDIYEIAEVEEIESSKDITVKESTTPATTSSSNLEVDNHVKTTAPPTEYETFPNTNGLYVNFENLLSINEDTKGWIKVEGTNINYPFVQANNNEYYLKHTFDKTSNKKGWVYLDYRNDIENLSQNNILYAHGLVNNTMFGSMRKVFKSKWYKNKNNHVIRITTPKTYQYYQLFSIYTILPESYYITTRFSSNNEFLEFANRIKSRSIYDFGININENDKILTLSSCYDDKKRMVMHAKLINLERK